MLILKVPKMTMWDESKDDFGLGIRQITILMSTTNSSSWFRGDETMFHDHMKSQS